jgi:hypothetical protein
MSDFCDLLVSWVERRRSDFVDRGVEVGLRSGNPDRDSTSVSVVLDIGDRAISGTVWDHGEVVLDYVDAVNVTYRTAEMFLSEGYELDAVLEAGTRFVLGTDPGELGKFHRYGLR